MRCEILTLGDDGQSLAGVFALQSGTVVIEQDHSNKAMQNILASPVLVNGHTFTSDHDPVEWMQALPTKYNGAYLRARLHDEGVRKDGVYYAPWIAVDLDGTLAIHTDMSEDRTAIGAPVPEMIDRVKNWLKQGKTVKIFTARVADDPDGIIEDAILEWSKENIGQYLEVTCEKDPGMTELWDDKAHGVIEDTGIEKAGSGLLVSFWLPQNIAEQLAVDGGEIPEEMHVTLAYMGKDYDASLLPALETALEKFADTHSPISGDIGGPSRFTATAHSDGKDVAIASVCCTGIQDFRRDLVACIESIGLHPRNDFEYTPHVTLSYIDPEEQMPVERIEPIPVTFNAITLTLGDQSRDIPLTGTSLEKYDPNQPRDDHGRWGEGSGDSHSYKQEHSDVINKYATGEYEQIQRDAIAGRETADVKAMDAAIEASPVLPEGTEVWRGIEIPSNPNSEEQRLLKNLEKGRSISYDGFSSVTTDRHIAEEFAASGLTQGSGVRATETSSHVLLQIKVAQDTRAAAIKDSGQKEFVLRRGSAGGNYFKIDKVSTVRSGPLKGAKLVQARYIEV